jgi:hypothetical protein
MLTPSTVPRPPAENTGAAEDDGRDDVEFETDEVSRIGEPGHRTMQQPGEACERPGRTIGEEQRLARVEADPNGRTVRSDVRGRVRQDAGLLGSWSRQNR